MLPPESAPPEAVAREIGVGVDTLERWRSESLSRPAKARGWTVVDMKSDWKVIYPFQR